MHTDGNKVSLSYENNKNFYFLSDARISSSADKIIEFTELLTLRFSSNWVTQQLSQHFKIYISCPSRLISLWNEFKNFFIDFTNSKFSIAGLAKRLIRDRRVRSTLHHLSKTHSVSWLSFKPKIQISSERFLLTILSIRYVFNRAGGLLVMWRVEVAHNPPNESNHEKKIFK